MQWCQLNNWEQDMLNIYIYIYFIVFASLRLFLILQQLDISGNLRLQFVLGSPEKNATGQGALPSSNEYLLLALQCHWSILEATYFS